MGRIVLAVIRMGRLHFLFGGVLMFFVGATFTDPAGPWPTSLALAMVLLAQVTAHYVNEYADYEADRAIRNRTAFSGGSGVLASGLVPRRWALRVANATTAAAALCAILLAFSAPWASVLGVVALAISWAYSMPPVRLLGSGWGELATALTIGGLVPVIAALTGSGPLPLDLLWTVAAFVLVYLVMLLAFELPDLATDVLAGKRVLAIRIGPNATALLMSVLVMATAALTAVNTMWLLLIAAVPLSAATVVLSAKQRYGWSTLLAVAAPTLGAVAVLVSAT